MTASVVERALYRLAREQATGVLRIGSREGSFFLIDGRITFAECDRATRLDVLLTASGRITEQSWQRARERGAAPATWRTTIGQRLGQAEFEAFVLLAVFDAAFFLLPMTAEPAFHPGERHWLDPIWRVTPETLAHETARRRSQLDAAWPHALADEAPVVPVRRLRRQRVILTGAQAELLLNADGTRTAAELAAVLGRTGYGTLLALRGLAAATLVQVRSTTPLRRRAVLDPVPPEPRGQVPGRPEWAAVEEDLLIKVRDALREFA